MKLSVLLVLYFLFINYNYTYAQPSFTITPLLARSHISATTVGTLAYFAGGELPNGSPSNRIDVYNRQTEQWSVEYLPSNSILSGAASLLNKAVFVSNNTDVYIYETIGGNWTVNSLVSTVQVAVGSSSKSIYIAGGSKQVTAWNNTWYFIPNMLVRPRSRIAIASALQTVVFAGGKEKTETIDYVEIFNEISKTRFSVTLSPARCDIVATSMNNLILLSGGISDTGATLANIEIYDVTSSLWSQKMMSVPRKNHAAASTKNGFAVFAGGEGTIASVTADIYDPIANQIKVISLGQPRMKLAAVSIGNSVMLAGGIQYPTSTKSSTVEFLDLCVTNSECQSRVSLQFSGSCNATTNLCEYSTIIPSTSSSSSAEESSSTSSSSVPETSSSTTSSMETSSSSSEEPSTTSSSTFIETSSEISSTSSSETTPPSSTTVPDVPITIECPSSAPYLCNDICTHKISDCFSPECRVFCPDINQCVDSVADCPSFVNSKCPFKCPDGTCGKSDQDCYCKNIPGKLLRCFDGSCQADCKNASAPFTAPVIPVQLYLATDVAHDVTIYGATEGQAALVQLSFPSNVADSNNVATDIKGVDLDVIQATSFPSDVMSYIASPAIDIKMYSGDDSRSPITSLQNPTKITFQVSLLNNDVAQSICLAFINTTASKWECVDRNLVKESNGSLVFSGFTNHFTSFAVLVESSSTSDSKNDPEVSPSHKNEGVPKGVVIGIVVGAVAVVVIGIVAVVFIRKRTRAQELNAMNGRLNADRASVNSADL